MDSQKQAWHLKKEISIGHILTTVTIVASMTMYIHKIDTRLAVSEARLDIVEKRVEANKDEFTKRIQAMTNELNNRLNRIADKLDKIIIKGK